MSDTLNLTEVQLAYLAAMIDGEGHISIVKVNPKDQNIPVYRLILGITNTNIDLLRTLQAETANTGYVTVHKKNNPKWKDTGHLLWNQGAAGVILKAVLPLLKLKQARAVNGLQLLELKKLQRAGVDTLEEQEALYQSNKKLNARGKEHQLSFDPQPIKTVRLCSYHGCAEVHYGNGFCRKHYSWVYESKAYEKFNRRLCQRCGNPVPEKARLDSKYCSNACKAREARARKKAAPRPVDYVKCSVEACSNEVKAQGLCQSHYMRKWHAANPKVTKPLGP